MTDSILERYIWNDDDFFLEESGVSPARATSVKAADPREAAERRLAKALADLLNIQMADALERVRSGKLPSERQMQEALRKLLEPELVKIAVDEANRVAVGVELDVGQANEQAAAWAKEYTFELVKGLTETTKEILQKAISTFQETPGMTREQLEALIRPAFSSARASMIAVTEVTRSSAAAQNIYQKQLEKAGIKMQRVWDAVNDSAVCPVCAPLDQAPEPRWVKAYPDGPPAHSGCRCNLSLQNIEK